jgi:hypothetical protein
VIVKGTAVTVVAVSDGNGRFPAAEWFESLELRDRRRAEAGFANFDAVQAAGIYGSGRIEHISGRHGALLELKLTRGGSTGPQLRMLGVLRGRTFFAATGFHKRRRRIPRHEILRAEAILIRGLGDESRGRPRGTSRR